MGKSVFYNIRRMAQVAAYNVASPEFMSKVYTRIVLKRKLNLASPKTFNDKLQWLKLKFWPNCEDAITCADKYRVRKWLEDKGFGEYIIEIYGAWDRAEDIDFDALPDKFVLKCNHGCGYNIIVNDKSAIDVCEIKKRLDGWMRILPNTTQNLITVK